MSTTVRVPASTSNLGAGFDCLGLALDLWLEIEVVNGAGDPRYTGTLAGIAPEDDLIIRLAGDLERQGIRLEIRSDIPVAKGLGSSAAATVAALALRDALDEHDPDLAAICKRAMAQEGHPDNAGPAVYGGLILSTDRPEQLSIHPDLGIAFAVPESSVSTKEARAILPAELPRETAIAQASGAAALILGLTTGNHALVSFGMDDRIATPYRAPLVPGFDSAVEAGTRAGAYGVAISGSGPTLVAITSRDAAGDVATAMAEALTAAGNPAESLTPEVSERGLSVTRRARPSAV